MKRLGEPEFWLLVFLAVLLAQSALGLFFPAPEAAGGIDVIIRTSAAGTTKISCEPGGKNMAEIRQDLLSLNYSPSFSLSGMEEADVNLSLPPAVVQGSITGTVTSGSLPLEGATVKLFDSAGQPYQHTLTDASGAFSFESVPAGTYSLAMAVDGRTYNGTVSGIIRDTAGAPVANCFVGLYAVTELGGVQTETLIASTRTNDEGKYLFGGVLAGTYMIKAKLEQLG